MFLFLVLFFFFSKTRKIMEYEIGMKLRFVPVDKTFEVEQVSVVGLRKAGSAKLSNGWLADAYGVCEGNASSKGANVYLPDEVIAKPSKMKNRRMQRGGNE